MHQTRNARIPISLVQSCRIKGLLQDDKLYRVYEYAC